MTYSKHYLTYQEYVSLCGSISSEVSFNILEFKCQQILNQWTLNRLVNESTYDNEVKLCVFTLIEAMQTNGNYLDGNDDTKKAIEESIINDFLASYILNGTPILYKGI